MEKYKLVAIWNRSAIEQGGTRQAVEFQTGYETAEVFETRVKRMANNETFVIYKPMYEFKPATHVKENIYD